jgi:cytochrome c5
LNFSVYLKIGVLNMKYLLVMTAVASLTLSVSVSAQEGKAVYDKACTVCHSMGVAGAPKAHDAAAWEPRLALGIDTLVATVKTGKNAMPPGGMCTDCTDDDYKNAIEYMSK